MKTRGFGGHENQEGVRKRRVYRHLCWYWHADFTSLLFKFNNNMFYMLSRFLSPQALLSYYYQISIPPQLLPFPNKWLFLLHILHIFTSSPLLVFLENTFHLSFIDVIQFTYTTILQPAYSTPSHFWKLSSNVTFL